MKLLPILAVVLIASRALAQTPELDTVLDKAGDYVTTCGRTFVGLMDTNRVLASELIAGNGSLRPQIDVTDTPEPAMGMLVPREMREKYALKDGSTIEGKATYANFRRYQVT